MSIGRLNQKQFNITQGPQGYTGPDGPSDERRLGRAYLNDMATINAGGDASYFPGQGTSQGKFFHDPKPHDAVRFQRGYTPERQQSVTDMITPRERPNLVPRSFDDLDDRNKRNLTPEIHDKREAGRIAERHQHHIQNSQATAEFVDTVARSDAPTEDLARLKRDAEADKYGITVARMSDTDRARASGQIEHGREISMPLRSEAKRQDWHAKTTLHEVGHALDHVDRRASGRPDYVENQQNLRATYDEPRKTQAVRQLGEQEAAADIFAYRHARGSEGESLANVDLTDYPIGPYSKVYGSDTGYVGGRNARRVSKFTPEESKAFRGGYQAVHKAEGVKSPTKRGKALEKEGQASRDATNAAWGEAGRPQKTWMGSGPAPQLQYQEDEYAHPAFSDEKKAAQERNSAAHIPWKKY